MKFPFVSRRRMKRELKVLNTKLRSAEAKATAACNAMESAQAKLDFCPEAPAVSQVKGLQDRRHLFANVLQGEGIEIGALHHPLPVPNGVRVRYVDYKTREQNILIHPELDAAKIVETDFVCDGEKLEIVGDESQDFVIANHMVEHCINPLGTIQQFLRVLRPGGLLFIALPDKRYTFDVLRPVTPFSNPAEDFRNNRRVEPLEMYHEFENAVNDRDGQETFDKQANIHFHAWTQGEILELFIEARRTFNLPLEIELAGRNGIEFIVLLRKEIPEEFDRAGMVSRERQAAYEAMKPRV